MGSARFWRKKYNGVQLYIKQVLIILLLFLRLIVLDRIEFLFVITMLSCYLCFSNVTLGAILFSFFFLVLNLLYDGHCRWRAIKCRSMLGANCPWAGRDLYRATSAVTRDLAFAAFGLKAVSEIYNIIYYIGFMLEFLDLTSIIYDFPTFVMLVYLSNTHCLL